MTPSHDFMTHSIIDKFLCILSFFIFFIPAALSSSPSSSVGDTTYGNWAADSNGNPVFAWRGGSSSAPGAVYPMQPTALHSAGNDRVSAIVFSDGTATLRQDEGGPKLLHGYAASPSSYQFRGAAGYVSNGTRVLGATVLDGSIGISPAPPLLLELGMGYSTKTAPLVGGGSVAHTVLAPFGDASLVLSLVTLSGVGASPPAGGAVWTEAWAVGSRWEMGWGADAFPSHNADAFQASWGHTIVLIMDEITGLPIGLADAAALQQQDKHQGGGNHSRGGGSAPLPSLHDPSPRPSFFVCLSCSSGSAGSGSSLRSYTSSGAQVFCATGSACADASVGAPLSRGAAAILRGLDNSTSSAGGNATILALQAAFGATEAGEATPLSFAVGYLTAEDETAAPGGSCAGAAALIACVRAKVAPWVGAWPLEFSRTGAAWGAGANDLAFGPGAGQPAAALAARARAAQDPAGAAATFLMSLAGPLTAPPPPPTPPRWSSWEGREAAWHSYSLRSALSFDDFSGEFTLNQNGNYLFISGQNAAARDPLAHVMGLTYGGRSSEGYALGVLNATLLSQKRLTPDALGRPAGSIIWGLAAFGETSTASFNQSDIELAAFFTLSQYVLATRDATGVPAALWGAAWASFEHLTTVIGTGAHGLVRLLLSDHNDGLLGGLGVDMTPDIMQNAESVMNSAFGAFVLPLFADAIDIAAAAGIGVNASARAAAVRALSSSLKAAVAGQHISNGTGAGGSGWYRRAWLGGADAQTGWRGSPETDGTLWTETQSWALLAGVPQTGPSDRAANLVAQVTSAAREPSPIGAINTAPDTTKDGGVGYGGVWACGDVALILALGLRGWPDVALEEWRKSSLASHATVYPDLWFGATAGADVWNSAYATNHNATPGSTRCQWNNPSQEPPCEELAFPIMNSWAHTLGTVPLPALVGAEWGAGGLTLRPPAFTAPADAEYTVFTPLLSVSRGPSAPAPNASCALAGHWAPRLPAGALVQIQLTLAPADAATCSNISINAGAPIPLNISNSSLSINATLVGDPPLITWELR